VHIDTFLASEGHTESNDPESRLASNPETMGSSILILKGRVMRHSGVTDPLRLCESDGYVIPN
jgi:hypothetical protein